VPFSQLTQPRKQEVTRLAFHRKRRHVGCLESRQPLGAGLQVGLDRSMEEASDQLPQFRLGHEVLTPIIRSRRRDDRTDIAQGPQALAGRALADLQLFHNIREAKGPGRTKQEAIDLADRARQAEHLGQAGKQLHTLGLECLLRPGGGGR